MEVVKLPSQLIGERMDLPHMRPVDKARSQELADSISEIGLLSPIIVRPAKRIRNGSEVDGWHVLSGRHRFHAMSRILHWDDVPCIVMQPDDLRSELITIDENLVRRELSDAERAYQTSRRKEIYEALHPETAHGMIGNGREKSRHGGDSTPRFSASTAASTGRSERSVQRDAQRGEALGPTLNRIIGTSLDKPVEIDALAALPHQEREEIVARAERGETVSARKPAEGKTVVKIDTEEMQANTVGRRLMREYLEAPRKAQRVFDGLYAEVQAEVAKDGAG